MLILFDMDNVLYDYNWRIRMDLLSAETGHGFHELRRRWWHDAGEWAAERGDPPTGAEYLKRVEIALEREIDQQRWLDHRRAAMTPKTDIIEVAQALSTRARVAVLTNNGALIGEHLPEIAPELVDVFGDQLYATAYFGARKPEPAVFQRAIDHFGVTAAETFFIDDLPDNIRGAEQIGITGHWFSPGHSAQKLSDAADSFIAGVRPRG